MRLSAKAFFDAIDHRRTFHFCGSIFSIILSAFLELLTLVAIIPFTQVLLAGGLSQSDNLFIYSDLENLGYIKSQQITLIFVGIVLILSVIASFIARFLSAIINARLIFKVSSDIDKKMLFNIFNSKYEDIIKLVPTAIVDTLTTKAHGFTISVLYGGMAIIVAAIMVCVVIGPLLYVRPLTTLLTVSFVIAIYALMLKFVSLPIKKNSAIIANRSEEYVKVIIESISNIRDLILFEKVNFFVKRAQFEIESLRNAQMSSAVITASPRLIVEAAAMLLIAIGALILQLNGTLSNDVFAGLAAMVLASQRLLPVIQQAFHGYTDILKHRQSTLEIAQVLEICNSPISPSLVKFSKGVEFTRIIFKYKQDDEFELKADRVYFAPGEVIAITGESGSGKSTLVDILMGLLVPQRGELKLDGEIVEGADVSGWYKNIAHVAQKLQFVGGTLAENIAIGVLNQSLDKERIQHCLNLVQWPKRLAKNYENDYDMVVLQGAINISGGERQRIGIARALYLNRPILVLDEATNALDEGSERLILENILKDDPSRIVIIINHRPDTLIRIDRRYHVSNGIVTSVPNNV